MDVHYDTAPALPDSSMPPRFRIGPRLRMVSVERDRLQVTDRSTLLSEQGLEKAAQRLYGNADFIKSPYFKLMLREQLKQWLRHFSFKEDRVHVSHQAEQGVKARMTAVISLIERGHQSQKQGQRLKAETLRLLSVRLHHLSSQISN